MVLETLDSQWLNPDHILDKPPRTYEVVDLSHSSSPEALGSNLLFPCLIQEVFVLARSMIMEWEKANLDSGNQSVVSTFWIDSINEGYGGEVQVTNYQRYSILILVYWVWTYLALHEHPNGPYRSGPLVRNHFSDHGLSKKIRKTD